MALHDIGDALHVGWTSGGHDRADLAEELGFEHARRNGDEKPRRIGATIDKVVYGAAWDEELEPFRHASDDAPVVWLHKVG